MRDNSFYTELERKIKDKASVARVVDAIPDEIIRGTEVYRDLQESLDEQIKQAEAELKILREKNGSLERELGESKFRNRDFLAKSVRKIKERLGTQYRKDLDGYTRYLDESKRQQTYLQGALGFERQFRDRHAVVTALDVLCRITDYARRAELFVDNDKTPLFATPAFYQMYHINSEGLKNLKITELSCDVKRPNGSEGGEASGDVALEYGGCRYEMKAIYRPISLKDGVRVGFLIEFSKPSEGRHRGIFRWTNLKGLLHVGDKKTDVAGLMSSIRTGSARKRTS